MTREEEKIRYVSSIHIKMRSLPLQVILPDIRNQDLKKRGPQRKLRLFCVTWVWRYIQTLHVQEYAQIGWNRMDQISL